MSALASGGTRTGHPPCPACSSTNAPLHDGPTHASICPDCGILRSPEDVLTSTPDFSTDIGYGTHSGALDEWGITAGLLKTMREAKRRGGAKGKEASQVQKLIVQKQALSDIKQKLNATLARLDGIAASHPLVDRIFNTFKTLRARCQNEEQLHHLQSFLSYRNRIVRFAWGRNAQAALVACIYAVYRSDDLLKPDAALHRCHSLPAIAHAAEVPIRRAQKWFRALRILLSDVFPRIKADEPIFYVDDIVQALRDSNSHLTPSQRRLIAAIDVEQVRLASRRLCHQVLQTVVFAEDNPVYRSRSGVPLAEWAYYTVLWAMSAETGQVLKGNVWLKREIMERVLSGVEDGADNVAPDSHIAAFHSVGHAIAQRAACIPWTASTGVKSTKRRRTGQRTSIIKDDEIPKYVKPVIDFGPSLEQRFEEDRQRRIQLQRQEVSNCPPPHSPPPQVASEPSYTSQHHPILSAAPALIDGLTDDLIDSTLFEPDEMDSYLRTPGEVDVIRRARGSEWDEAGSKVEQQQRSASNRDVAHHTTVINGRPTKTKADERLLALALAGPSWEGSGTGDAKDWNEWSDSESESGSEE